MCLPEQTGAVAGIANALHPGAGIIADALILILPDAMVVRVAAGGHGQAGWHADRGGGYAVIKAHAFIGNAVHVRCLDPVTAAAHGVPTLLVAHDEKYIWFLHALNVIVSIGEASIETDGSCLSSGVWQPFTCLAGTHECLAASCCCDELAKLPSMSDYQIKQRGADGALSTHDSVQQCFAGERRGVWLIVVPHDDDLVIGSGLLTQAAAAEGIEVHVAVATDGSMGYCDYEDKDRIVEIRREEQYLSCEDVGIPRERVHWCMLQDGALPMTQGTTPQTDGSVKGLAWEITTLMRQLKPVVVFSPTPTDYHPDHRVVASEVDIACFHASGEIWSQLGEPVDIPERWDYAVYCPFAEDPDVQLTTSDALFDNKVKSIARFQSQRQIAAMVESCRKTGAFEYYKARPFNLYDASKYKALFA